MPKWFLLTLVLAASPSWSQTVVLDANFDDKAVDAAVGTGGPAVGEPVSADGDLLATIRSAPFATPSLEMQDSVDFGARFVRFTFLPQAEITTGVVSIHMELWFTEIDNYLIYLREYNGSSLGFLSLRFDAGQFCTIRDAGGSVTSVMNAYGVAQPVSLDLVFDMDNDTYDMLLDNVLVVDDEPHDVDPARGPGAILLGTDHDSDLTGHFFLDNLLVTATNPTAVSSAAISQVKSLFRGSRR